MSVATNTLLGMHLFSEEIRNSFILHIPHSSFFLPDKKEFVFHNSLIYHDMMSSTDWGTDTIFYVPKITTIKADFSRIFCDVERFYPDELEPMSVFGRGYYYTKTATGEELRENDKDNSTRIYEIFYKPYHKNFTDIVDEKLEKNGVVHIIDCHSFSDTPLDIDFDQTTPRPSICIGTDEYHTPDWLLDYTVNFFQNHGFSVKINSPYAGTIVPQKFYKTNPKVHSIMIEINKKEYMTGNYIHNEKVEYLSKLMNEFFDF
jgi:N-formylglutamate amidohydrolase